MQFTGTIVVESESVAEPVDDYPVATVSPNRQTDLRWERRWQAPLGRGQNYRFPDEMSADASLQSFSHAPSHPAERDTFANVKALGSDWLTT